MRIAPEISSAEVVLRGTFNPATFTPAWFGWHGVLSNAIATNAQLHVASNQITAFSADWLRLEVTPERFIVRTEQEPHIRLYDFVLRVFEEHLHHAPLTAFGINRTVHFKVSSMAVRDRIGRRLAPVAPWGDWGQKLAPDGQHGGMTSLTMTQVNLPERPSGGMINVTVQPSAQIDPASGIYVQVNDHYAMDEAGSKARRLFAKLFKDNFDTSLTRSDGIIDHLMSLAQNHEG